MVPVCICVQRKALPLLQRSLRTQTSAAQLFCAVAAFGRSRLLLGAFAKATLCFAGHKFSPTARAVAAQAHIKGCTRLAHGLGNAVIDRQRLRGRHHP